MGRINNKTNKSNPVSADEFIIYDSEDTTDDKNVTLGQIAEFTEAQDSTVSGDKTFSGGCAFSKGLITYGAYSPFPTGYGNYVASYVSPTYGARLLGYNGSAYQDLSIGSMPTAGIPSMKSLANGDCNFGYNVNIAEDLVITGDATANKFIGDGSELTGTDKISFAINSGQVDASGNADLLAGITSTTLSFKVDDGTTYKPLQVTYADGSQEVLTSLASITGLSTDGTYTVIKEKGLNPVAVLTSGILGGTALSGGDLSGYPVSNAFDGNLTTDWSCLQDNTGISGVANLGKNFVATVGINSITLIQGTDDRTRVTSVKVQSSADGTTWVDVKTFNSLVGGTNILILDSVLTAPYVRLLANSNCVTPTVQYHWLVFELTFNQNQVTQGKTFPASTDGDYHCLTATGLQTYKRVSGAWVETQYVPIGTATVANNVISAVTSNRYNVNGYDGAGHNIVETYVNGTSWYRVWSDGWCEQGGGLFATGTVTFLKQFKDTNITLLLTRNSAYTAGITAGFHGSWTSIPTTTGFTCFYDGTNTTYSWQASGYLAQGA